MTKLLEKALDAARGLPDEAQDEIARAMLAMMEMEGEPEAVDAAHLPAVLEGLAQARRREFATEAEIEAAFRRFDPRGFALQREQPGTWRQSATTFMIRTRKAR